MNKGNPEQEWRGGNITPDTQGFLRGIDEDTLSFHQQTKTNKKSLRQLWENIFKKKTEPWYEIYLRYTERAAVKASVKKRCCFFST